MAEPIKNLFNADLIMTMGKHLAKRHAGFNAERFADQAVNGLEELEFKQRSAHILAALEDCLPDDFRQACTILTSALHPQDDVDLSELGMDDQGIRGWAIMPMCDYVASAGLHDFDYSMDVLREMTKRMSAEFAVRPFLASEPERALGHIRNWSEDSNYHVRRLASEGIRPRLPWGMRLNAFVKDPSPLLPILETLKDDPSDYVRRSVANNLNDISKDHPDLVAATARSWLKDRPSANRKRLVRHACRSLIKAGHRPTLKALGYRPPALSLERFTLDRDIVQFGDAIGFSADIRATAKKPQDVIIDYVVHHQKANGTTSPKVFKWKSVRFTPQETVRLERSHAFRPITTRAYYGGTHAIEIQANGQSLGRREFTLKM
ncbi:DNA alkylation repair protein [Hoeflea prorocentri]|uniref:DNA alkylation repair protein n=1 Tax=Hoeflea prorocentri TaxID=1922333 RepID=A0A9X3ZHR8_9HYPH|nr:DNA alkylation repair protein [Hoeflea prorocentri]MCY6381208.1 DNA alkylation repair protein [Hoeflea prorocentri]MDA5399008.1 DNA alkylation repair protein [Hoeflea prorocentri]